MQLQYPQLNLSQEAERILARPGALKASEKARLHDLLDSVTREVGSNLAFTDTQFQEQLDKSVTEAESSLQGALAQVLQDAGLSALEQRMATPQLEEGEAEVEKRDA